MASLTTEAPQRVVTREHVKSCSLPTWYVPLRKLTIRSVIIPVPSNFLRYLQEDGIRLPNVPSNVVLHPNDPRNESGAEWSDEDGDEAGDGGAGDGGAGDETAAAGNLSSSDDDEDDRDAVSKKNKIGDQKRSDGSKTTTRKRTEPIEWCFHKFEQDINAGIKKLGGQVFPKFDWSSPRDASFLKGGTKEMNEKKKIYIYILTHHIYVIFCFAFYFLSPTYLSTTRPLNMCSFFVCLFSSFLFFLSFLLLFE